MRSPPLSCSIYAMDTIVVLDFGGQYCHLISRRVRDLGVYSTVAPASATALDLKRVPGLKGIILSGGAASAHDQSSPKCDPDILPTHQVAHGDRYGASILGVPVLGICYGHQLIAHLTGGKVETGAAGEYGTTQLTITRASALLKNFPKRAAVWMNHRDIVTVLAPDFVITARTSHCPIAAFENTTAKIYGVQFHPEVTHTPKGLQILKNFVLNICRAQKSWNASYIIEAITNEVKKEIGSRKTIIGLSGGVDSSTAAALVGNIIGPNLTAVYVDTGLMRLNETDFIKKTFAKTKLNLRVINAREPFFKALAGVTDPEEKRKTIGRLFIEVFEAAAQQEKAEVLVQGTIYSDRIESGLTRHSSRIKSHHNVAGLPERLNLKIYEPLRELYKDEVRAIAAKLGLPKSIIQRHVFPGPGLGVRILGEVTLEKAEIARQASAIVEEELQRAKLYDKVWMGFAVLLPIKSVGVQGDERTYKYPVAVRVVESTDAMTANFTRVPWSVLEKISTRITNEIKAVNRVVYDISNKPPATMEWE